MNQELRPVKSVVLYSNGNDAYAEIHDINKEGEFGAGRPMKSKELILFDSIVKSEEKLAEKKCFPFRNIIGYESNVLSDKVAWIYPASKVTLFYGADVKGLKTGEYYIPNILFVSDGSSVDVYAIKRKDILNLSEDTQLYTAPFFNVYKGGDVCMGSAKVAKFKNATEMIYSVENAFFDSVFTHTNMNDIVKGSLIDCYNNQNKKFDEKLLLPTKKLKKIW